MKKTLKRSQKDSIIAGVLGGIAEYLEIDSTLVRLLYIVLGIFHLKAAILIYILLYIFMPAEENEKELSLEQKERNKIFLGLGLLIIGVILLLDQIYHFLSFNLLFPLALIGVGIYLILKNL